MIEIHSKTACPYCDEAKNYLTQNNISYTEHIYDDFDDRQAMYDRFGLSDPNRTVPQMFLIQAGIKEYIGGYSALVHGNHIDVLRMEDFDADF